MLFTPEDIPANADLLSSPLRNNFELLRTLFAAGIKNENCASDMGLEISKTALGIYTTPTTVDSFLTNSAGTGTYTTVTIYRQVITRLGKTLHFEYYSEGTVVGNVLELELLNILPNPASTTDHSPVFDCEIYDGLGWTKGTAFWRPSRSAIAISLYNRAALPTGASVCKVSITGDYITA